ncbi:hypothetical protein M2321_004138 [Rhodoblastus acidophilus]|nr:AAA family ATPase [Rhodoblastus acidophilus]MCW2276530.1 hypothetical protein [Rhodoblastus acidophilus]
MTKSTDKPSKSIIDSTPDDVAAMDDADAMLDALAKASPVADHSDGDDTAPTFAPPLPMRPSPDRLLPQLVLDRALGSALKRRLRRLGPPLAVVVQAPDADWVAHLAKAAADLPRPPDVFACDGTSKAEHRPTIGNDDVSASLRNGRHVIGVSQAPAAYLPSTLTAVADAHVAAALDARTIRRLVSACVGRPPRDIPDGVALGLSFHDILAAFRAGASPAQVVAMLVTTSAAKRRSTSTDDVPPLDRLPGLRGPARDWGLGLVSDVQAWRRQEIPWSSVPASAVLVGPPGVGKTLFAKSVAVSCQVPIIELSIGAAFAQTDGHLNAVCRHVSDAFSQAKQCSGGALLFADEMEAIPDRATLSDRNRDYWTPLLNLILTLSSEDMPGVIKLGCSNFANRLDAALVRPGRFDRVIELLPPDAQGLADVLRFHGCDFKGADLAALARLRPGATGADAASWARAAKRIAREAGRDMVLDDLVAVIAPDDAMSDRDRRRAAVHEAGHALAGFLGGRRLTLVSILSIKAVGGRTVMAGGMSVYVTRADAEAEIAILLAGRAAEIVVLGDASAGASSDLYAATSLVAMLHCSGGLGADLVHRATPDAATQLLAYDPVLRRAVADDLAVVQCGVLDAVRKNRAAVVALADVLVARRFVDGAEAEKIIRGSLPRAGRKPKTNRRPT